MPGSGDAIPSPLEKPAALQTQRTAFDDPFLTSWSNEGDKEVLVPGSLDGAFGFQASVTVLGGVGDGVGVGVGVGVGAGVGVAVMTSTQSLVFSAVIPSR
jgi:hypothetical protein